MYTYIYDRFVVMISGPYALQWTEEWKLQSLKHFSPSTHHILKEKGRQSNRTVH